MNSLTERPAANRKRKTASLRRALHLASMRILGIRGGVGICRSGRKPLQSRDMYGKNGVGRTPLEDCSRILLDRGSYITDVVGRQQPREVLIICDALWQCMTSENPSFTLGHQEHGHHDKHDWFSC